MTIEQGLHTAAGSVVPASLARAHFFSPYWPRRTAFAGVNLLQSGFTNSCPMVTILRKAGLKPCVVED